VLPGKVRTDALVGQTPYPSHPEPPPPVGHGRHYTRREVVPDSADVVGFLKHLARHISGKLLVLWDGVLIHLSRIVKEYLSNSAAVATGCYSAVSKREDF
jgi:hypothetical protein